MFKIDFLIAIICLIILYCILYDDGVNDEEEAQADNLELGLLAPSLLVLAAAANSANFFDTSQEDS